MQYGPPIVSYYLALRQKYSGPLIVSHLAITEMVPDLIWGLCLFGPQEIWSPINLGPEKFGPQECWSLHENPI